MNPFLLPVKFIEDKVYLGEGSILYFGSLFMCGTVLYVVQVVLVSLHAYLAVGVLFIRDGFKDVFVIPWLNIIISFICPLLIFVIFSGSSFFDSIKILHDKCLFSSCDTRTIAIWCDLIELVDVIFGTQLLFCRSYRIIEQLTGQVACRRCFLVNLSRLDLSYSHLHASFGRTYARASSCTRQFVALGWGIEFVKLMKNLSSCDVSDLELGSFLALLRAARVEFGHDEEGSIV